MNSLKLILSPRLRASAVQDHTVFDLSTCPRWQIPIIIILWLLKPVAWGIVIITDTVIHWLERRRERQLKLAQAKHQLRLSRNLF